jgi:malic enzyme
MNTDPIVFALANPVPEIWPEDAKAGGAKIVATGRGDFPNQVNNCIAFPSIFRGMLEVRSRTFNADVLLTAAKAIAASVGSTLSPERIIPSIDETDVFVDTAVAVSLECIKQSLARIQLSETELRRRIEKRISRARMTPDILARAGLL